MWCWLCRLKSTQRSRKIGIVAVCFQYQWQNTDGNVLTQKGSSGPHSLSISVTAWRPGTTGEWFIFRSGRALSSYSGPTKARPLTATCPKQTYKSRCRLGFVTFTGTHTGAWPPRCPTCDRKHFAPTALRGRGGRRGFYRRSCSCKRRGLRSGHAPRHSCNVHMQWL